MTESQMETFEDSGGPSGAAPSQRLPQLFVVLECDRPTAGGARYALEGIEAVEIGRGLQREIRGVTGTATRLRVGIPGRSMSASHAVLKRVEGGFSLEDLRSTNGSFVNGTRVQRALLQDNDVFELGHTLFVLRSALPTPASTPSVFDSADRLSPRAGLATLLPSLSAELATLSRVAASELTILLVGETGTGKEVTARAVHELSRRSGPFVAVNCGALTANLVESLLFGHVKGAFSGAHRDEPGFLRSAGRGTLLLDEIGDLPIAAQAALLRVLEQREVVPVGGARPVPFEARVIAATHRSLETMAAEGRFRGDLLARLDGYRCRLPRLAERREDLGLIVREVLQAIPHGEQVELGADAGTALALHDWPFNIRELVQVLRRAIVVAEAGPIRRAHILASRANLAAADETPSARELSGLSPADAKLRDELIQHLNEHRGNVADVARAMGKARMQIHRWLQRYDIDPGVYRLKTRNPGVDDG